MQIRKLHAPRIIHDTVQEEKDIELSSYKSLDEVIRPRLSLSLCYGLHVTEFCYFVFLLSRALNFPFHLISWGGFTDPQLYWRLFEFACRLGISNIHISVPRCSCWLSLVGSENVISASWPAAGHQIWLRALEISALSAAHHLCPRVCGTAICFHVAGFSSPWELPRLRGRSRLWSQNTEAEFNTKVLLKDMISESHTEKSTKNPLVIFAVRKQIMLMKL